ncbi:MAG: TonB-dependent receptor, partial [Novosphingobium sp.]
QVEVLRGPQGTLFGQGASAGVINIKTVSPSTDGVRVSGGIDYADKGTAGSEVSEVTVRGAFNLPFGDQAALRVAGQYRKETGLQRNTALGLDNEISDYGIRARFLAKPSETVTVNLGVEYTRNTMDGWNFFGIAIAPNRTNLIDPDGPGPAPTLPVSVFSNGAFLDPAGCNIPAITERAEFYCEDSQAKMRNEALSFSSVIDVELSDRLTLTSVSSYRTLDRETDTVNFSRRLGVAARNENLESESSQVSQELRLAYAGEGLDLVVGGMYSQYDLKTTPIDNALPFGNPFPGQRTGFSVCLNAGFFCVVPVALTFEDTNNRVFAGFADATLALSDKVDLFGGLRISSYTNTTGVGENTNYATRISKIDDDNISGRIGISYKPNPDATLFASYARGYKPPAIVVPTIASNPVTVLQPEDSDAVELGGKLAVGRLQLSGNVFWSRVKNFQTQSSVFDVNGALISVTQNISKVESYGFELGAMGRIGDHFTINTGYQFNVVKFPTGFVGNDGVSLAGEQFINAPKHKFTLSGEYTAPVGGAELFVNGNLVWKSEVLLGQYGDPRYRYPAHALVNASIGVRDADGKWTLSVFARNLTKQREPSAYLASDFAGNADGGIRAWPVAGLTARVVGVSVGFDF